MKLNSLLIILGAALFFGACSNDDSVVITPPGEDVTVQLSFKTVAMQQAGSSTRSGGDVLNLGGGNATGITFPSNGTRSTDKTTVDESTINNLWVFQYITGGNFVRKQYFSTVDAEDFRMDLSKNASGEKSNLYFVANVGPNAFPNVLATEDAFKANGISVTDEASVLPTTGFLPMSGSLTDLTLPDDFVNNSNTVTMTRMVNRVDLSFQLASTGLPAGFRISSVSLMNVPNKSFPYKDASATIFPASTDVSFRSFSSETIIATDQTSSAVTLSFYLPENARGDGTSSTAANKTGISGATYIQLFGYTDTEEVTYRMYPGSDVIKNYDLFRNTIYTVKAGITGINTIDKRVRKTTYPDANSYIVRPGSYLIIPIARVNNSDLGKQLSDITTGWTPEVIWRDNSSLSLSPIVYGDGRFMRMYVSSGATGNALVCIRDASRNILWSWHIWITDYKPETNNETYNGYTFMDRNLGAMSDTPGDVGALGLFYQWGRKDPFAGSSSINSNSVFKTLYSGRSGSTIYTSYKKSVPSTSVNNLQEAVRRPGTFFYGNSSFTVTDWYSGSGTVHNDTLWGTTKTIYDPCPYGWKIPPNDAFSSWSSSTVSFNSAKLGYSVNGVSGSWYPLSGLLFTYNGTLNGVGNAGFYLSSSVSSERCLSLYLTKSGQSTSHSYRVVGSSVRCVKE